LSRPQELSGRIFSPTLVCKACNPQTKTKHRTLGTRAKPSKSASQTAQPRAAHQDFAPADTRKFAVRYLATIRIAAINEWLPRHL
jgi:hypothetical protein